MRSLPLRRFHRKPDALLLHVDAQHTDLDDIAHLDHLAGVLDEVKSYLKEGNTVIITSHEEAEIMLCDAVYFLENGTLTRIERDELDISKLVERMRTE